MASKYHLLEKNEALVVYDVTWNREVENPMLLTATYVQFYVVNSPKFLFPAQLIPWICAGVEKSWGAMHTMDSPPLDPNSF